MPAPERDLAGPAGARFRYTSSCTGTTRASAPHPRRAAAPKPRTPSFHQFEVARLGLEHVEAGIHQFHVLLGLGDDAQVAAERFLAQRVPVLCLGDAVLLE